MRSPKFYLSRLREEKLSPKFLFSRLLLRLNIGLPLTLFFDRETQTKVRFDTSTAAHKIYLGRFNPRLNKQVFKQFVSKGATVIDVGANIGMYSLLASRLTGNDGRVFSFEPTQDSFDSFLGNILLNGASNIMPVQAAVSEQEGVLDFIDHKFSKEQNRLVADAAESEKHEVKRVRAIRLDRFLDAAGIRKVDFMKIDVEGAELLVLRSLGEKISSVGAIYFECRKDSYKDFGYDEKDLFKYLRSRGFAIVNPYLKGDSELAWDVLPETANIKEYAGDLLALNQAVHSRSF